MAADTQWFYNLNGVNQGPLKEEDFIQLIKGGHIARGTLVWNNSLPNWTNIDATELAQYLANVPPPLPQQDQSFFNQGGATASQFNSFFKSPGKRIPRSTYLLFNIFLGSFGAHKFYSGNIGMGIAYLLLSTVGGIIFIGPLICFILVILDIIKACNAQADDQGYITI